jgi:O-antigen/teichoic acid export membrane protein
LEKEFDSTILAKYNVVLLVSNLPIIFATAINSIFIQKILIYNDHDKKGQIINFTAKIILVIVFLSSFFLISFKSLIFSFFNIFLDKYEYLLFYFFLLLNTFINFCWLQIANELSIHKITNGFYIASVLSFLITYFSFNFFISEFFILGAGLTLVLSNFIIFSVAYIYARKKVDLLVKFKPLINLYLVFVILVIFYHLFNQISGLNNKWMSIFINCIIFILMSSYLVNLKNKFKF